MVNKNQRIFKNTQIRISPKTYQRLVELGSFEDTFDSIIQRFLPEKKKVVDV